MASEMRLAIAEREESSTLPGHSMNRPRPDSTSGHQAIGSPIRWHSRRGATSPSISAS